MGFNEKLRGLWSGKKGLPSHEVEPVESGFVICRGGEENPIHVGERICFYQDPNLFLDIEATVVGKAQVTQRNAGNGSFVSHVWEGGQEGVKTEDHMRTPVTVPKYMGGFNVVFDGGSKSITTPDTTIVYRG